MRASLAITFALGALVGASAVLLLTRAAAIRQGDDVPVVDSSPNDPPRAATGGGPSLAAGRSAASSAALREARSNDAATPTGEAATPGALELLRRVFVDVDVTSADGIPDDWSGTAYALPARSAGVDDVSDVAHQEVTLKRTARLPVAAAGTYDVGLVWPGGWSLLEDVAVDERVGARAAFVLPRSAAVRVICEGDWSTGSPQSTVSVKVALRVHGSGIARAYPGRGERPSALVWVSADLAKPTESTPLPVGTMFDASAQAWKEMQVRFGDGDGNDSTIMWTTQSAADDVLPVVSPKRAAAGAALSVSRKSPARWKIRVRTEPDPWPRPSLVLELRWSTGSGGDGEVEQHELDLRRGVEGTRTLERAVAPGTARVAWSGDDVIPVPPEVFWTAS